MGGRSAGHNGGEAFLEAGFLVGGQGAKHMQAVVQRRVREQQRILGKGRGGGLAGQHLLMSETISRRTWQQPARLQEDILATRFSGFRKSFFTGVVTDVLPFHSYSNYLTLNGVDYHNPISAGFWDNYTFSLTDELLQGTDTVWVFGYRPRRSNANAISGTVAITSAGFSITHLAATHHDTVLRRTVHMEQQYALASDGYEAHWFPAHLNYTIEFWQKADKQHHMIYTMNGSSLIDSVRFQAKPFRFDKAHTARLIPGADELNDSAWAALRPLDLSAKERKTYHFMDSLGEHIHLDKALTYLPRIGEGLVTLGPVDVDITRLVRYNKVEHFRLGAGVQTNEKLLRWLSLGGWAGYGFRDAHWKYGGFATFTPLRGYDWKVKLSYDNDIYDPGQMHIHRDIDKQYLSYYLLQRVDRVAQYAVNITHQAGYLAANLQLAKQHIDPQYTYQLLDGAVASHTFIANEAALTLRYAYGERTAPFMGVYHATSTNYPILYARIATGTLQTNTGDRTYSQFTAAASLNKHINRIGRERLLLRAGVSLSSQPLPVSKLFAGPGYRYGEEALNNLSLYAFGGLVTMYPYGYYTDRFLNVHFRHDFDFRLYTFNLNKSSFSSSPGVALQYGLLYGSLTHREAQLLTGLNVPDVGYHEVGMLFTNLIRIKYMNVYYLTLSAGYFAHITPVFNATHDSRVVAGVDVEL
ncbi:MAG: hypothetical protein EBZ77_02895 [Chitinophagia bacterium]|nr:hypothetical protein [Chitinophagia bacterium]